ncbi:hypothetical protein AB0L33_06210 [Streptomyces sp. NPDC052299]|uniref:hypothetical protein n=1 Tax=Streptomyces sp. NPDC052299 TaxID=3155054 RepID=UPI00342E00F3
MQYPPYPKTSEGGPPLFPGHRMGGMTVALVTVGGLIALAVVGGLVGLIVFAHGYGEVHADMRFPADDVTVTSCDRDEVTGRPVAGIRVTSEAARPGTYTVHVVFRDLRGAKGRGVEAGEGGVTVARLAVGATASGRVTGPVPVWGRAGCELGDVTFDSTGTPRKETSRGP